MQRKQCYTCDKWFTGALEKLFCPACDLQFQEVKNHEKVRLTLISNGHLRDGADTCAKKCNSDVSTADKV